MVSERRALIDSMATFCLCCKVPYGEYGCTHAHPPVVERKRRRL